MTTRSWLSKVFGWMTQRTSHGSRRGGPRPRAKTRLGLEALEDRLVPAYYTGNGADWMSNLPGDMSLSQISIPGTHDTMTYTASGIAKCQSMTLNEQLNAGVRYLDIRVSARALGDDSNDLGLWHGPTYLGMNFNQDVVDTCEDFLRTHPNETIVMVIGNERDPVLGYRVTSSEIDAVVGSHMNFDDPTFWYKGDSDKVPTLKDVRRKIVVLDGWGGNYGIAYDSPDWTPGQYFEDNRFYLCNEYAYTGAIDVRSVIHQKVPVVKASLDLAQVTHNSSWFITNTSANVSGDPGSFLYQAGAGQVSPFTIAEGINWPQEGYIPGLNQFLSNQTFNGRVGTVVMDFPHLDVINSVIGANFDIALSNALVPKNAPTNTVVGVFSTTGGPAGLYSYELVDGVGVEENDNSAFSIDASGKLLTKENFDFGTKPSYSIRVRSTEGGLSVLKEFTIGVADITLSNAVVPENVPEGTFIGSFSTTDPDAGDSHSYALVSGPDDDDNRFFAIYGDGTLWTRTSYIDFEAKSSYSIRVQSTDLRTEFAVEKVFTINVANVNEAPTALTLSNATVAENAAGATVGTLTVTDPDAGDTWAFAVSDSRFEVVGAMLKLKSGVSLDFEAEPAVNLSVTATDSGGLSITKSFTISVTNVNEAPTDITLRNSSIPENAPSWTVIDDFLTTDPDRNDTHTYALVPGAVDNDLFHIMYRTLRAKTSFDFEAKPSYEILVRSTDAGGLSVDKLFTISVTNVNEAPTDITLRNSSIPENAPSWTVIDDFLTTDPDRNDTHTYALVPGAVDNDLFHIMYRTLRAKTSFDFEAKPSYEILVRSTDAGGLSVDKLFTISVTNVNEAPTDINLSNTSIPENAPIWTIVGTFTTIDPDNNDTWRYSLVPGSMDNALFLIEGRKLRAAASFDFETKPSYQILVRSTDAGGLSVEKVFTINVTDVNEAPTLKVPDAQIAYEDAGKAITGIRVGDPDGDNLSVTLAVGHGTLTLGATSGLTVSGNGTGSVSLSGSIATLNAALATLNYRGTLNFSGADSLSITASDGSLSGSGSVAINVKSAAQQAADLQTQINALDASGALTSGQGKSLTLELKNNIGDAGKVQAFLNKVAAFLLEGILTQAQADALSGPGKLLLLSVTRR